MFLRLFVYAKVFSFMQNLGGFDRTPWAKSWTTNNVLVFSIIDDISLKGTKAHVYLQFNR